MVKIELEIHDIDYDTLIRQYLPRIRETLSRNGSPLAPLVSGALAETVLLRSPDSVKDRICAELINTGAGKLELQLQSVAAQNGIQGAVRNLHASSAEK